MLVDADAATATARVTALAAGPLTDAAMVISQAKSKMMHIHRKTHVSSMTEDEVEALTLAHKCDAFSRTFPTQRGMKIQVSRWSDGGVTQCSRRSNSQMSPTIFAQCSRYIFAKLFRTKCIRTAKIIAIFISDFFSRNIA